MTNVRRPIHLHLRPATSTITPPSAAISTPKALSPAGDSLPSQILPYLFVGSQEQTNRESLNRLNISYILSLGLLPLISSPTSPTLPSRNSSKDFKVRIRATQTSLSTSSPSSIVVTPTTVHTNVYNQLNQNQSCKNHHLNQVSTTMRDLPPNHNYNDHKADENVGFKVVRSIQCKCINIADNSEQILSKFFDEAHQFIDEARRKKCNILVHCQAGISRSPTIAIAYLMRVNSLPLQEAYNLVKQCRPQTDPNLSFMGQLMIYEKSLDEQKGHPGKI